MRRARAGLFGPATLLLVLAQPLQAATDIIIDLARDPAGTTEVPVPRGSYSVTILHLAPHYFVATTADTYRVTIAKEEHALAPLPLPNAAGAAPPKVPGGNLDFIVDPCLADKQAVKDFKAAKSTSAAYALWQKMAPACADMYRADLCRQFRDELVGATEEAAAATVLKENQDLADTTCKDVVGSIIDGMTRPEGTYDLRENQSLIVTISRGSDKTLRTWKFTYNAPASQAFRISYGFNFIPNADHEYYAKANPPATATPSTASYTLTEKNQTKSLDFAPSIFFSFPMTRAPWEFAIAAGLGFDLSAPIVFLGPSLIMNQNIQVIAGAVMQQQETLRGEYNNGQTLTENLTNDQVTQKTYRPNWFVGLAFRFDTNPFANNSTPAKVATPAPTPSPTPKPTDKPKVDDKPAQPPAPAPVPAPAPAPAPARVPTPAPAPGPAK